MTENEVIKTFGSLTDEQKRVVYALIGTMISDKNKEITKLNNKISDLEEQIKLLKKMEEKQWTGTNYKKFWKNIKNG